MIFQSLHKLFVILIAFISISISNVYASACSSSSCNPVLDDGLIYLRDNSIYGDLLQRIVLTNCCTADISGGNVIPRLEIGVIGSSSNAGPGPVATASYAPLVLNPGQSVPLRNLPGDPIFTQDPALASVTLKAEWRDPACPANSDRCSVKLCLTMPTFFGYSPLKCKTYNNVVPPSTYSGGASSFGASAQNTNNYNQIATNAVRDLTATPETCNIIAASCDDTAVSQAMFSFSGPAIQCLTDSLRQNFFDPQPNCILENDSQSNVNMSFLASFASFQEALKISVRALLILYTIGFGMKMLLNQSEFSAEAVVMFIMKMFLVAYFAVGWGPAYFQDGVRQTENGTIKWTLPILTQMTSDLASMTFGASTGSRGLCEFDNNNYPPGYGYYGLWDRIDCKLGAYLLIHKTFGFGFLDRPSFDGNWVEVPVQYPVRNNPVQDRDDPDVAGGFAQLGIFVLIFGLFLGGQYLVFLALIYFMVVVLSILLGFISLYTVCLVTLHVLIYLSPIFVPMALFERTKTYFDSWVKVTLSCALQPMVLACFLGMVMSLYDEVFFGTCEFKRHDYTNGERYKSTFEIRIPENDPGECLFSTGYVLISYLYGLGGESYGAILFTVYMIKDVMNIWLNCIMLLIFSYIMRFFMDGLYTFASDITGGLNVSDVALNMRKIAENLKKGVDDAREKIDAKGKNKGGGKAYENKGGGDKGGDGPSMDGGGGKNSDA
jgi:type IV secretion system protein VirB6